MNALLPRRYFNLNIRHSEGNWCAKGFLGCDSKPRAPIFYGERTIEQLKNATLGSTGVDGLRAKELGEAKEFLGLYENSQKNGFQPVMVTIDDGRVWIYEPIGEPVEVERIDGIRDKKYNGRTGSRQESQILVKAYDVRHLSMQHRDGGSTVGSRGIPTSEVPLILSSMKVNQAFSRNTFTEIYKSSVGRYKGNIAAIMTVLGESGDGFAVDPLDCLSAVEFETLVAKLYEAQNCFVPAYRGGVMKDVDLYVYSDRLNVRSVQLKLSVANSAESLLKWIRSDTRNVLISLDSTVPDVLVDVHEEGRFIGRRDIRNWINNSPVVKAWLDRSLDWLPQKWRRDTE
jgi:hypothetical protein